MRAGYGVDGAFGVATAAGGRAQGVGKFLHQQGLVAMQGVEAFEAALEVVGQLSGGQLHSEPILGYAFPLATPASPFPCARQPVCHSA